MANITIEAIHSTLDRIEQQLASLQGQLHITGSQVKVVEGLSDISQALGLIKAGEFRSGTGNPGFGFTGVRMGSPGWLYDNKRYSIVGVNNDVMQFGLSAEDGNVYAGEGRVRLNQYGIQLDTTEVGTYGSINFRYADGSLIYDIAGMYGEYSIADDNAGTFISSTCSGVDPWATSTISLIAGDNRGTPYTQSRIMAQSDGLALLEGKIIEFTGVSYTDQTEDNDSNAYIFDGANRWFVAGAYNRFALGQITYPTWRCTTAATVDESSTLLIEGAPTLVNFTANHNHALQVNGATWINGAGLNLGTYGDGAGDGDMSYGGDLMANRGGVNYTGYIYVPLATPAVSTSWDGDARSTTAKTLIDLSAVFGLPAGIKAVAARIIARDSAVLGTSGLYAAISSAAGTSGTYANVWIIGGDLWTENSGIISCNADGDIYFECTASGAGTLDFFLQINGYFI